MIYSNAQTIKFPKFDVLIRHLCFSAVLILLLVFSLYAQENLSIDKKTDTLIIEEVHNGEVYAFGKNVLIRKGAKGVFAFGGDVIIEGRIEGDAAALGGSIIQKEGAFIGGDVVVIGGTYKYEEKQPQRNPGKETIMFASYEEELRGISQNPARLFAPSFTRAFLVQRILSVLFWFVISLALTTIAPGAVSRSVARFQLSTLKIFAVGFSGFLITTIGTIAILKFLPNSLSAILGLMVFVLLILAYVFGRVALQVSVGKRLLKNIYGYKKHSESAAILLGTLIWTILLSIPYIWTFVLLILFAASIGIVLTARSTANWEKV
ncbi:MAG: hypothetical protein ACR2L1_01865 [Pyrinomonadaceae bacterium]